MVKKTMFVAVSVFLAFSARANASRPGAPLLSVLLYDSGVVAAGAVITSPVLDLRRCSGLRVRVLNADGAATRALTMDERTTEGGTAVGVVTVATVGTSLAPVYGFAPSATVTSSYVAGVPLWASFSLAAAGSSNGRLIVICQIP